MKKTITVNLNGVVFQIDEDAYTTLQEYLQELDAHFNKSEDKEILIDIEARIAELFSETLSSSKTVITIEDVTKVIERLGHPNQFDVTDEEEVEDAKENNSRFEDKKKRRKYRKFFRDPENQIIAGVCSGIAAYLNWDPIIVRLIFVALPFLSFGYIIPIYLILWLVVPEARTAAQRLEMRGEDPTLENIKRFMESEEFKDSATRIGNRISDVFQWLFRILFGFISIIIAFVLVLKIGRAHV